MSGGDLTQLEYVLAKNPWDAPGAFWQLGYDISLLNCAKGDNITDYSGTDGQHEDRISKCPGYENGIAVTFGQDLEAANCAPIHYLGQDKCMITNTRGRTKSGGMSGLCHEEYKEGMTVDLCVEANADADK